MRTEMSILFTLSILRFETMFSCGVEIHLQTSPEPNFWLRHPHPAMFVCTHLLELLKPCVGCGCSAHGAECRSETDDVLRGVRRDRPVRHAHLRRQCHRQDRPTRKAAPAGH